jgi:hypothetical protein
MKNLFLLIVLFATAFPASGLGQTTAEQNLVASARERVYDGPQRSDYATLDLSLKLTTETTFTHASNVGSMTLPDGVRGEVLKSYLDPVSGFQAYRLRIDRSPEPPLYTYTFAATQITTRGPDGELRRSLDTADVLTNFSFGLHQMESAAATELMQDVLADLRNNNKVMMTGQSLGGMMSHGLGYLVARQLREAGELALADNLSVRSWGIPGVGETIRNYIRRKHGREEELDPALLALDFEEFAYAIDPLRGIGEHFGRVTTIDSLSLAPDEGDGYTLLPSMNIESHLLPAFERAVRYQTIPLPGAVVCGGEMSGFRFPRPIQGLITDVTGMLQRMNYRRDLARNGTEADWQRCYSSARWYTDKRRNCTSREQRGCQVRDRRAPASGQEMHAQWCMVQ